MVKMELVALLSALSVATIWYSTVPALENKVQGDGMLRL